MGRHRRNRTVEEMLAILKHPNYIQHFIEDRKHIYEPIENYLAHYGTKRHSGRYPWGSGKNPFQHVGDFYSRYEELRGQGLSEKEIADYFEMSTGALRRLKSTDKDAWQKECYETAQDLMAKGMTRIEAAKRVGLPESTLRTIEKRMQEGKITKAEDVAALIKARIDEVGVVDVGESVELELGCSAEVKEKAMLLLEAEGYVRVNSRYRQVTNPNQKTNLILMAPPGTDPKEAKKYDNIHSFIDYEGYYDEDDGDGVHPKTFQYPESLDSSRLKINYNTGKGDKNDGGAQDGNIIIRPGREDLNLEGSNYAQVRIMVDGTHYLKGMATYGDPADFPDGVDVIFNTNKKAGTAMTDVLKGIKTEDPDNPFGTTIKEKGQRYYIDADGNKKLSLINKCRDEGDWNDWSRSVPSQMLSKQNSDLAKRQMNLTIAEKENELADILALTNPVVKGKCLLTFADECDSNAVSLKTKSFPGQSFQVILPVTTLKDNECYAPNYAHGQKLALIRFPHGGIFEIPIVTNNVNNKEGKKKITPNAKDAVGINANVASILSGADFDGDTVMCIPISEKIVVSTKKPLSGLVGFDPKSYKFPSTMSESEVENKRLKKKNIGREMGGITNLIADMSISGQATEDELTRAVKHSMVVIDAYKHKLDYKKSEKDNNIAALKKKYQGSEKAGASTIITKAKSEERVPERKDGGTYIDPKTGETKTARINPYTGDKLYTATGRTHIDKKTGKEVANTTKTTKMAEASDARELLSSNPTPMENLYADYANNLKDLARTARKEYTSITMPKVDSQAAKTYKNEVASLNASLQIAKKNAPKERIANIVANSNINAKKEANPLLTTDEYKEDLKKIKQQEITKARTKVGATRTPVTISEKEWEAIQNNAISKTKLSEILDKTDMDVVKSYAMPKKTTALTTSEINLIKAYSDAGYTNQQIADKVGVSLSSVIKYDKK